MDSSLDVPPCWPWSTPEDRTVQKPLNLKLTTRSAKRLWPRPTVLCGVWWQDRHSALKWCLLVHTVIHRHVAQLRGWDLTPLALLKFTLSPLKLHVSGIVPSFAFVLPFFIFFLEFSLVSSCKDQNFLRSSIKEWLLCTDWSLLLLLCTDKLPRTV